MSTIPAIPQKQPLRLNPFHQQSEHDLHTAYDQCLASEHEAETDRELMYARCLGYFLTEVPCASGQYLVAKDILLCNGDKERMDRLAELYINRIICLFRQNKGNTPESSHDSSWSSFDDKSYFLSAPVEPVPRDHRAAKRTAFHRDNYKCMATGVIDTDKYLESTPAEQACLGFPMKTNFCHIFPPSTNWDLDLNAPDHPKITYAEHLSNLVDSFGGIQVLGELKEGNIHKLSNGLTLKVDVHYAFDELLLWFEEVTTGPPNTYLVRSMIPLREITTTPITFTSSSPELALPDPRYLKLHAAVCRVAHMSGASEYLGELDHDMELMPALAEDGSSTELLASRLQRLGSAF